MNVKTEVLYTKLQDIRVCLGTPLAHFVLIHLWRSVYFALLLTMSFY